LTETILQQEQKTKKVILTLSEAKEVLSKVDAEKADQIQKRTLDYLSKFTKVPADRAKEIRTRLVDQARLTEEEAVEIVNIMPHSLEELRVFTAGWRKLIPAENLEKVLKILSESS
jgi:DNA-directed RNA polymerase subunit F